MTQPVRPAELEGDLLPVAELLCFATYSANNAFGRAYKPLLDRLGLTYPQYLVMVVLWEGDEQTVGAIGQKLFLESNTLTPLLKRLEAQELVTRTRATHDERQVVVRLTEKGHALRHEGARVPGCMFDLLGLDLDTLTPLLKRLEAQELVTRTRATHDERQVVVRLTEKGRALRQEGARVPGCMFDLLGLDLDTLNRIRGDLAMLRERLAGNVG